MRLLLVLCCLLAVPACKEKIPVVKIEQKRERTLFDEKFSGNLLDNPPPSWRAIPGTDFRLKNYLAGPNEEVEIFFGQSKGSVLDNANRWRGQFGEEPAADLSNFTTVAFADFQGYLVEVSGSFGGGMGAAPKENWGLLGAIAAYSNDSIMTVKMTGPAEVVMQLKPEFLAYIESLRLHAPQIVD